MNKVKAEFERKFRNKPVGSRLIVGLPAKREKSRFPLHGMLPPQKRFTGGIKKPYTTAYNGFMQVGQPRQHRFDNLVMNSYFKQVSGLIERFGSKPLLIKGQEEKPVSRELLFRQAFPELRAPVMPDDTYSEDFEDATAPGPQDLDDLSTLTPSIVGEMQRQQESVQGEEKRGYAIRDDETVFGPSI